jgi:prepilin peptidase CpaA
VNGAIGLALLLLLALAVWQDLVQHRIPNLLTVGGLIAALLAHLILGGLAGLVDALAGATVGFGCFLPLYLFKGTGAGDVKLMAAVGAFLGAGDAFVAVLLALVAGGALALCLVISRLFESRTWVEVWPVAVLGAPRWVAATWSAVRKERFPYAVAIAVGTIGALCIRGWVWDVVLAQRVG